jgi:beta-galactosidase
VLAGPLDRAGLVSELPADLRGRVELAVRGRFHFLINRTDTPIDLSGVAGTPLTPATSTLPPRGVAVLTIA